MACSSRINDSGYIYASLVRVGDSTPGYAAAAIFHEARQDKGSVGECLSHSKRRLNAN